MIVGKFINLLFKEICEYFDAYSMRAAKPFFVRHLTQNTICDPLLCLSLFGMTSTSCICGALSIVCI